MKNFLLLLLAGIFFGWTGYLLFGQFKQPVYFPAPVTPTSTPPFIFPESAVKGWKVYVNDTDKFYFSYPPNMRITGYTDKNDLFLNYVDGKQTIYIDAGFSPFVGSFEEEIKSWAGEYPEDNVTIVNTLFEKVVDTEDTLGFLSRWNITRSGKLSQETKADFESKFEVSINPVTGRRDKKQLIFKKIPDSIDLNLFRQIVSTVRFYR